MKRTTITRKYDVDGHLTEEVEVTEEGTETTPAPYYYPVPYYPQDLGRTYPGTLYPIITHCSSLSASTVEAANAYVTC